MADRLEHWLSKLERRHFRAIDMGLERCSKVYDRLGSPRPAGKIITVGGTNGKGSVVAYLSGILAASDYRCGAYTSPHILRFNERIGIMGVPAADADIVRAFETVEAALQGISLTYFEFTTLAAFHLMHEAGLDAAVLEVGLGGRLDTVNLVDADCAVITPIGLDHQEYLGPDREAIGYEKAGIMRPGRPLVCGDPDPPASIAAEAAAKSAILLQAGVDFHMTPVNGLLEFRIHKERLTVPGPSLPGRHQAQNLGVALAALRQVFPELFARHATLGRGIAQTRLSGRLERCEQDPRVLLDVGHNPLAAAVVADYLGSETGGECYCVLAMLRDKAAEEVAKVLAPHVHLWLCAGLKGPRGQTGADLARRIGTRVAGANILPFTTVAEALSRARAEAGPDGTILVFGSFETTAAALRHLGPDGVHGQA